MVLQELGGKLTAALQKMQSVTVISEEVLDKMLKDIAAACGSLLAVVLSPSRRLRDAESAATVSRQHLGAVSGPCLLCETRVAELQWRAEQAWASGVRH